MNKTKEKLTFTNIIFVIATIIYILNLFVVSPDTGSRAVQLKQMLQEAHAELPNTIIFQILGFWGGHLNDMLGFNTNKILSGEIWRVYTVVVTHNHLPHFIMNMVALIIAGNKIEKQYGTKKTIGLFAILTPINLFITNFIYFNLLGNEVITICGASGWITVLMGMILTKCLLNKGYFKSEFKKGSRAYLIIYFISTTFILMPNLFTITAHISGLIEGAVAEFIIYKYFNKSTKKMVQV